MLTLNYLTKQPPSPSSMTYLNCNPRKGTFSRLPTCPPPGYYSSVYTLCGEIQNQAQKAIVCWFQMVLSLLAEASKEPFSLETECNKQYQLTANLVQYYGHVISCTTMIDLGKAIFVLHKSARWRWPDHSQMHFFVHFKLWVISCCHAVCLSVCKYGNRVVGKEVISCSWNTHKCAFANNPTTIILLIMQLFHPE